MERIETHYFRSIFVSGLAFGIGGAIGIFALYLLIRSGVLGWPVSLIPEDQSFVILLSAISMLVIGITASAGLGGAIGGFVLSTVDPIYPRSKYIWRTGISAGVAEGILILPLLLLIALIALYNNGLDRDPSGQVIVFGIFGVVFGIVFGLIQGLLTVGWRQVWRLILASVIGFGLGGAALGFGLRVTYNPNTFGRPLPEITLILPFLTFIFFGIAGLFLGWVYEWVTHWRVENVPHQPAKWVKALGVVVGIMFAFFIISNYRQLIKFLTINPGSVSTQLSMETIGVHWEEDSVLSRQLPSQELTAYSLSANGISLTSAVWVEENGGVSEIILSSKVGGDNGKLEWGEPLSISSNPEARSIHPEVIIDKDGINHIVWTEQANGAADVYYSRCENESCSEPIRLSIIEGLVCEDIENGLSALNDWPVIAINKNDALMVLWSNASNVFLYSTWDTSQNPPETPAGCFTGPKTGGSFLDQYQPRISGGEGGSFHATFSDFVPGSETVYSLEFLGGEWSNLQSVARGTMPDVFTTTAGVVFYSWCTGEEQVGIKKSDSDLVETIDFPACKSRPAMAEDEKGELHLVWYSDQVRNNENVVSTASVVYESIHTDHGWSEPAIVAQTKDHTFPRVAGIGGGDLSLLWSDNSNTQLFSAKQPVYECSEAGLSRIGKVVLDVAQRGSFRPEGDTIPYCGNSFIGLIYMPNPESTYTPQRPNPNGGFDTMSDLASLVEYEVLLSVMEWASEEDAADLNPGRVYTREIANLYQQIKEDPSRYPRGLNVRILLGNYPELANLEWGEQIWNVINDLRAAGVDKMVDPEIGWKVEVANYEGVFPHSHTKFLIIDGKVVVGAGFNYGYLHFPFEHPSGKGGDLFDLGLIISGPIAQQALTTFDDYWQGADQLHCPDLSPDPGLLWTRDCIRREAQATHVPEVMKFFLPETPGTQSNAFSLNRNINYKESDEVILEVISSAQESLDIMEVNFSLELICMLDLLNDDVCSYENALDYMRAIMTSVEKNQTKVRVLVEKVNSNGMENRVAAKEFTRELEKRGLSQYVEIKFFEGRMHAKAFLADDEMLFIGSQNFHYSAWGEGGLAEYNVATDDPRAIEAYKNMFDYYWEIGIPWEEYD